MILLSPTTTIRSKTLEQVAWILEPPFNSMLGGCQLGSGLKVFKYGRVFLKNIRGI